MQTRSRSRAVATSRRPQSVAALLPEEILDLIFAQVGYEGDRSERYTNLSHVSVIAEGWMWPARRLLFREVKITSWSHLQETVEEGRGNQVKDLMIWGYLMGNVPSQKVAGAVCKLLKQLPNLRQLRLICLPFISFDPADSSSMQSTVLLPHLRNLSIKLSPTPNSIIFDLLATSDHQVTRLTVEFIQTRLVPLIAHKQLDFRGNLRFLSTGADFYRTLADPRWNALEGLRGLEELQLQGIAPESREGEEELYRVIAPTLSTLVIHSDDDVTWAARFLPSLSKLIRLSIGGFYTSGSDPAPLLRRLPSSLSFLRLKSDLELHPHLVRWTANLYHVPTALKQIQIDEVCQFGTYQQLPPVQTLGTNYRANTLEALGRLAPSTLPFKTLEMFFYDRDLGRRSLVEAECARLGVTFRQVLLYWDA